MGVGRTKRMHTVPEGYFEAFAITDPARRSPGVWRFDRASDQHRVLGIGDTEVVNDIYTVYRDDGTPDLGIENEILCGIEGEFCAARRVLRQHEPLSKAHWAGLARFIAAQLLRTPRFLQSMRDVLDADGIAYKSDTLPHVMLLLIGRWIPRLARMRGILAYNETGLPLLTCDNPAVAWKKAGEAFICGVDQFDPELVISCPLAPDLAFVAYQTADSLKAVYAERHDLDRSQRLSETFVTHIDIGSLPMSEVKRLNHICVSNAHRYVYSNYSDTALLNFLQNRFVGAPAPLRSRDLQAVELNSTHRLTPTTKTLVRRLLP